VITLPTGQKLRFKGRNGITRAREVAAELNGACIRKGTELEITRPTEIEFKPGKNGAHLTPLAEQKIGSLIIP
jgi:hypothetical protein